MRRMAVVTGRSGETLPGSTPMDNLTSSGERGTMSRQFSPMSAASKA
jgi:hypothetical protein